MLRLLLRYTQALLTQMTQTAVCNRHHSVEQQLCRWLLLRIDRLPSNSLSTTQELIANTLGVRREGVTEAAGNLQRAGLIRYKSRCWIGRGWKRPFASAIGSLRRSSIVSFPILRAQTAPAAMVTYASRGVDLRSSSSRTATVQLKQIR